MVYPGGKGFPVPREMNIHIQQNFEKKMEVANFWNIKKNKQYYTRN